MIVAKKNIDQTFGKRLRALREAEGLTLIELAQRIGIPYQNIARLERSEREPVWGTVLKLAKALEVTPDAFTDPLIDPPVVG